VAKHAVQMKKQMIKEKCLKERIASESGYTNPAKLMNFMRAKKAKENRDFKNVAEYTSHIDAYSRLSTKMT